MFGRVAACGIAAFLIAMPTDSNGEANIAADLDAATVSAAAPAPQTATENQLETQTPQQTAPPDQPAEPQREGGQAHVKIAALDPAEPTNLSPAVAAPAVAAHPVPQPFGLATLPIYSGGIYAKWTGVEADIRAESDIFARCRASNDRCPSAARKFLAIVAEGRAQTGRIRIGTINRAVNLAIRPMSDLAQWGVVDRWSAPLDTFTTGLGDCEDYAIAKYVALIEAGIPAEDVRLVIVRDAAVGEDHAVTAVRLDGEWIVLDNRWLTMVDDTDMRRLQPLFVLDETGVRAALRMPAPDVQRAAAPRQGIASAPSSLD